MAVGRDGRVDIRKRHTGRRNGRRGFTLLEALVAMVLGGIVMAGVAMALRTGLDAQERIEERSDRHSEARALVDVLAADLSSAYLSRVNTEHTYFTASPAESTPSGEPFLSFTTLSYRRGRPLPDTDASPRSDAVQVDYLLQPHPAGEPGRIALARRERWLTETGPGVTEIVSTELVGLRLGFSDGAGFQEEWSAGAETSPAITSYEDEGEPPAPSERELPRAVQVTLLLPPPSGMDEEQSPRSYQTVVLVHADGTGPFETQVVPRPAQ